MTKSIFRNGDVRIEKIDNIPKDIIEKADNILMMGEASGHSHRITSGDAKLFILPNKAWIFLKVTSTEAIISHEEHEDIMLPMGDYKITPQFEYDWFNNEIRKVTD